MSKKHKKINARSITEAKKAQQPRAVSFAAVPVVADLPKSAQILTKKEIQLPIAEIKKDLVKNLLFIGLLVVIFFILAKTHFGYNYVAALMKL